jgi:hypothetical protein
MSSIRFVRAAALAAAIVATAGASAAKDLCVHTTAGIGYTFVLKKAATKAGAFGTVSGYAVPDGFTDLFIPISASFFAFEPGIGIGITRYAMSVSPNTGAGGSYQTAFHNIDDNNDRAWEMTSDGDVTIHPVAAIEFVDCATVPVPPR